MFFLVSFYSIASTQVHAQPTQISIGMSVFPSNLGIGNLEGGWHGISGYSASFSDGFNELDEPSCTVDVCGVDRFWITNQSIHDVLIGPVWDLGASDPEYSQKTTASIVSRGWRDVSPSLT